MKLTAKERNAKEAGQAKQAGTGWLRRVLCVVLSMATALTVLSAAAFAEEASDENGDKTLPTDLEQFLADWGEPVIGQLGEKNYTIDFEEYETGTDFSQLDDLLELWTINNATGDHITKVEKNGDNQYLAFAPFAQMYLQEGLTDKYVYSLDISCPANQGFGVFFRSTDEISINPFFEDDQSGQNILGIGPAGIYIIPNDNSIRLFVKYYDERKTADSGKKYLNNKVITIKVDCNFGRFQRISIADYGTGAKIFVNGKEVASLEFSEVVDGYEELLSDHTFYSKVRVTYNGGAKTTEVNNALVCADSSTLALGMRINSGEVDNIVISEYEDPITSIELDSSAKTDYLVGDKFGGANLLITYETGATKKVAVSEDMLNGFDTATAGEKTVKIAYGETELEYVIHVTEPAPVTEEPVVTAAPTAAPEKQDDTTEKSNKKALTVGLIAGGVLILAIAAVLIILNAKKKK